MKKLFCLVVFLSVLLIDSNLTMAQITGPSEGKAVVYFLRPTSAGAAVNFRFYHQDKYIGKFNGNKYMRYECEPGTQLFWSKSENLDFITADVEAGKIYLVQSKVRLGGLKARVKLEPVDPTDAKLMAKIEKLTGKKPPVSFDPAELKEKNEEYAEFIQKSLDRYESDIKDKKELVHIDSNSDYSLN